MHCHGAVGVPFAVATPPAAAPTISAPTWTLAVPGSTVLASKRASRRCCGAKWTRKPSTPGPTSSKLEVQATTASSAALAVWFWTTTAKWARSPTFRTAAAPGRP